MSTTLDRGRRRRDATCLRESAKAAATGWARARKPGLPAWGPMVLCEQWVQARSWSAAALFLLALGARPSATATEVSEPAFQWPEWSRKPASVTRDPGRRRMRSPREVEQRPQPKGSPRCASECQPCAAGSARWMRCRSSLASSTRRDGSARSDPCRQCEPCHIPSTRPGCDFFIGDQGSRASS